LITHPYKTLRKIRLQKDFSQALLVLGLPFYLWLFLALLFVIVKLISLFVVKIPPPFGLFGLLAFVSATVFLVLAEFYIFFWLAYYLKVKKRARKEIER